MPERSEEVEAAVRSWLAAKTDGDAEAIRRVLSRYEGALAIGTEAAEWWAGAARSAEAHTATAPFSATLDHLEAHAEGAAAWAALRATARWEGGSVTVRLTLVLVREDGDWRVVQSHASVPEP